MPWYVETLFVFGLFAVVVVLLALGVLVLVAAFRLWKGDL